MVDDLSRWIELARVDASRRRHETTSAEHLLGVVLRVDEVRRELLERRIDPAELLERLEAHLVARGEAGGYRDGGDALCDASVDRVVARRSRRRGWWSFKPELSVFDAILLEQSVARLVVDLRRGADYRHLLERARALAITAGHRLVGLDHVFQVLVDIRSFVDTVERAGGEAARLRDATGARLAALAAGGDLMDVPDFDDVVQEAWSCGPRGAYAGAPPLSVREACLELAKLPASEPLWSAAGLRASEFVRAVYVPGEDARRSRR